MKKLLTLTLIFFFLALSVTVAFSQPQRIARAKRTFDRSQNRILIVLKANQEGLVISDEQIAEIEDLVFSSKEKTIRMNAEQSRTRLELQELMKDRDNLDYGKIQAVLSKTSAVRNEMFIEGLKLRAEISNVLAPEQREALKSKLKTGIRSRTRDLRNRMLQRNPSLRYRIRRQRENSTGPALNTQMCARPALFV